MNPLHVVVLIGTVSLLLGVVLLYFSVRRSGWYRRALPWVGTISGALALAVASFMAFVAITYGPILAGPDAPTIEELDSPAENFAFRLVADDAEQALADFRGNVVLVNLWATWCAPCIAELGYLNRLQEEYREDGLVVITLSNEARDEILPFAEERPFATVNAYVENAGRLPQPFRRGYRAIPTTYVLDREGYIREFFVGARDYDFFEGKVVPLL